MTRYQAFFTRNHKTRTERHEIGEHAFDLAARESLTVELEAGYDPIDPHLHPYFVKQATEMLNARLSDADEWETPVFEGAREWRPATPPPVLLTPKDSPAWILAMARAREYPSFYGDEEYAPFQIWNHWFFVIGNGMEWNAEGVLVDDYGPPLAERVEAARQALATPLSPAEQAELAKGRDWEQRRLADPFPRIRVKMYPGGRDYSRIFAMPDHVEPSYLTAALDMCRYFLHRPIWECCAYDPAMRGNIGQDVYKKDGWRPLTLADGATYRAMVLEAYCSIVVGRFRRKAMEAGYVDEKLPFDAALPPKWVPASFDPPKPLPPELAERMRQMMAEVAAENA